VRADLTLRREDSVRKLSLLLLLMPGLLLADVVHLKGGAKFTGRILDQNEEQVTIHVGYGSITVSMERVERIELGRSPFDEYEERAGKLDPMDVNGWRDLARWAAVQGLSVQSQAAYQKVLALAPDDPQAREALGYVRVDGRWVTEEESYRARGYVKYEGEWMSPAEVQAAQNAAARDQARDEAAKRASDAEYEASMERLRQKEAASAAQSKEFMEWKADPVYGWGYGVTAWPNSGAAK
jgi:hypothetical protein